MFHHDGEKEKERRRENGEEKNPTPMREFDVLTTNPT
jgi:hypothetical protein